MLATTLPLTSQNLPSSARHLYCQPARVVGLGCTCGATVRVEQEDLKLNALQSYPISSTSLGAVLKFHMGTPASEFIM